jgi:hypothetical protein
VIDYFRQISGEGAEQRVGPGYHFRLARARPRPLDQATRRRPRGYAATKITDPDTHEEGAAGTLTRIPEAVGETDGGRIVFRSTPRPGRLTMVDTSRSDTSGLVGPHVRAGS